jgi:cob(I)alamin adenosyltransferase
MKIYTKTGDKGSTSLFGGKRVLKSDLRIDTYGTIDELNSWIGVLRDQPVNQNRSAALIEIQDRLFTIGSILATEPGNTKVKIPALSENDIMFLEKEIDALDAATSSYEIFCVTGGASICFVWACSSYRLPQSRAIGDCTQPDRTP